MANLQALEVSFQAKDIKEFEVTLRSALIIPSKIDY